MSLRKSIMVSLFCIFYVLLILFSPLAAKESTIDCRLNEILRDYETKRAARLAQAACDGPVSMHNNNMDITDEKIFEKKANTVFDPVYIEYRFNEIVETFETKCATQIAQAASDGPVSMHNNNMDITDEKIFEKKANTVFDPVYIEYRFNEIVETFETKRATQIAQAASETLVEENKNTVANKSNRRNRKKKKEKPAVDTVIVQESKEVRKFQEIERKAEEISEPFTSAYSAFPAPIFGDTFYSNMRMYKKDDFHLVVLYDDNEKPLAFSIALAPEGFNPWDQITVFFKANTSKYLQEMLLRAVDQDSVRKVAERLGSFMKIVDTGYSGIEVIKSFTPGKVILSTYIRMKTGDRMEFHRLLQKEAGIPQKAIENNLKLYSQQEENFGGYFYDLPAQMLNPQITVSVGKLQDIAAFIRTHFLPNAKQRP